MKNTYYLKPSQREGRKSFYNKAIVTACEVGDTVTYTLQSYNTIVFEVTIIIGKGTFYKRLWDGYSATTLRHINSLINNLVNIRGFSKKEWEALPVNTLLAF